MSRSTEFPRPPPPRLSRVTESIARQRAPFSPRALATCVSTWCELRLGQCRLGDSPCGLSPATTRDASDQLLPFHPQYEHPRLVGSGKVENFRSRFLRAPPVSLQDDALRRAAPLVDFAAEVLVLPPRRVHAEPLAPLSRPSLHLCVCTRQASRSPPSPPLDRPCEPVRPKKRAGEPSV